MESKNKIELVVFDWAGTTVDYGSSAPSEVFDRVFRAAGLHLTKEEINRPMGLEKKAHIRELLSCESGRNQWQGQYGRPSPFMLFECMRRMKVYPPCHVVKVGDTAVDMQEGKNAGAFSIGILTGSNLLGLTPEEYAALPAEELARRKQAATRRYLDAGADLVIDSIRELPAAIEALNRRLADKEASL